MGLNEGFIRWALPPPSRRSPYEPHSAVLVKLKGPAARVPPQTNARVKSLTEEFKYNSGKQNPKTVDHTRF